MKFSGVANSQIFHFNNWLFLKVFNCSEVNKFIFCDTMKDSKMKKEFSNANTENQN